jgi:hypothetical protein
LPATVIRGVRNAGFFLFYFFNSILPATVIRGVPNTGIQFAVYEGLKTLLMIA